MFSSYKKNYEVGEDSPDAEDVCVCPLGSGWEILGKAFSFIGFLETSMGIWSKTLKTKARFAFCLCMLKGRAGEPRESLPYDSKMIRGFRSQGTEASVAWLSSWASLTFFLD